MTACACGCGAEIMPAKHHSYHPVHFLPGHNPHLAGSVHPSWKGGRYIDSQGYVRISCPDHPSAYPGGYVLEHRLIMERALGRYLEPSEVVHHINGIHADNREENLIVFTQSEHKVRHARERHEAKTFICEQCGLAFQRPGKGQRVFRFCSLRCFKDSQRGPTIPCARCGKPFHAPPSDKQRFCSKVCGDFGRDHPHWRRSISGEADEKGA